MTNDLVTCFNDALTRFLNTVAPLKPDAPKWRVMLYVNGDALYYADWHSEILADTYAADLRKALANDKIRGVFVRKELLRLEGAN